MAVITGTTGSLTMPSGFNATLDAFSATASFPTVVVTGFGESAVRRNFSGASDVVGSASGMVQGGSSTPLPAALADGSDYAAGDLDGTKGTLTMTFEAGNTWALTVCITNVKVDRATEGRANISFDFEGDGPMTQTWA